MKASTKNHMFLTGLILITIAIMLFGLPDVQLTMKTSSIALLIVVGLLYEYNRGYSAGKAYYTENNPVLVAKESKDWDHKQSLQELLKEHPFCLMELEHAPCIEHDYPLPSGTIHLVQNCKNYTSLTLTDDGWIYSADTSIGKDVLQSGKYQPMLTHEAIRISHDKIWDLYF